MRFEQLQRYFRYLRSYLRHLTIPKLLNALRVEIAYRSNNCDVSSLHPYFLFCDVSITCNLKCPLCQTGQRRNIQRESKMTLENYKKVVDPLKKNLFTVNLYNWAEPFLNKNIYEIISYNRDNNIATFISSNLSLAIDAEKLVLSGLEHLIVSADGMDQDVYEHYRVGGKIDLVVKNIKAIVAAKKKYNSRYPTIEWQCLVNKFNEPTLEKTKAFAKSIGVNEVRFGNLNLYSSTDPESDSKKWLPENEKFSYFKEDTVKKSGARKPCFWLWRGIIVAADGATLPCCLYDISGWGNAIDKSVIDQWRTGLFQKGRELSNPSKATEGTSICHTCNAPFIFK